MLFKKLLRTMWQYKAQFISMVIMIALGVGIFVGFNIEWFTLRQNTDEFMKETGFADYRIVDEGGLDETALARVEAIDGVTEAAQYFSANMSHGEHTLAVTVTTNPKVSAFKVTEGSEYDPDDDKGIWVSDKYAQKNNISVGDEIELKLQSFTIKATVRGMAKSAEYMVCVQDETQIMPNHETFGFAYVSPACYNALPYVGGKYYQINVISSLGKQEFSDRVNEALGKTMLVVSRSENSSAVAVDGEVDEGQTMSTVLPVLFLAIAVLTMVTTMHRLTAKEKVQIGTFKALGFKDRRISAHYTGYAFIIGLMGIVPGIGIGFLVAYVIISPNSVMGDYIDIPSWSLKMPAFCMAVVALLLGALTLVGYLSVKQMLAGTAAEALRPYQPKKMRKLLVERGKLWQKLGFGAQWNIRDVFRHKARTLMSLIGIVGCMILLVGAFGMRDTLNVFVDSNYNLAMNYNTKVFFTEDSAANERVEFVRGLGDAEWSSSVAVEIGDKTASMDIYSFDNDRVRFLNDNRELVKIDDDGAYICRRIADEHGLKVGDTIEVKPYGKDKVYKLTVKGFVNSLTESVIVSKTYADSVGVEYVPDAAYTGKAANEIDGGTIVKGMQSKQDIIDSFDDMLQLMNTSVAVLVLAALVLGIVVLYNLGVMSYTERYREMATLKVVGFKDGAIGRLLVSQNLWLTFVGVVLGLPLGILTLRYLVYALASEFELAVFLGPVTYIVSILLTFGVSLLVSLLVARKNRNIDMVEALKMAD